MYLSKLWNVFVQITKCICQNKIIRSVRLHGLDVFPLCPTALGIRRKAFTSKSALAKSPISVDEEPDWHHNFDDDELRNVFLTVRLPVRYLIDLSWGGNPSWISPPIESAGEMSSFTSHHLRQLICIRFLQVSKGSQTYFLILDYLVTRWHFFRIIGIVYKMYFFHSPDTISSFISWKLIPYSPVHFH